MFLFSGVNRISLIAVFTVLNIVCFQSFGFAKSDKIGEMMQQSARNYHIDRFSTSISPVSNSNLQALAAKLSNDITKRVDAPKASEIQYECSHRRSTKAGAVFMFFFNCPNGVNCDSDRTSVHVPGMTERSPELARNPGESGFYNPDNPGFWRRELEDARFAGLDFLALNVYGPDLSHLEALLKFSSSSAIGMKFALFDDTWIWGRNPNGPWMTVPVLGDPDAARVLYEAKWGPFFRLVPRSSWLTYNGRPVIFFYNGGTLKPLNRAATTLNEMAARFAKEFNTNPILIVDSAFYADPQMPIVADAGFVWDTFRSPGLLVQGGGSRPQVRGGLSFSVGRNVNFVFAMTRWDSRARDKGREKAASSRLYEDASVLERFLTSSSDANISLLATWNDIGEGTGVNRALDYTVNGHSVPQDYFLQIIRKYLCH